MHPYLSLSGFVVVVSSGRVILYSVIRGWALLRFLSGSQVSSAVEYPVHLIRKV